VKSWYVTLTNDVLYTSEIPAKEGALIYGNMTKVSTTEWYIGGTTGGRTAALNVKFSSDHRSFLTSQPWAYNTAECYGCGGGCDFLPTVPCNFTKLELYYQGAALTPAWVAHVSPNPVCSNTPLPTIVDPQTVSINFQEK